jgi:hypothetical protein
LLDILLWAGELFLLVRGGGPPRLSLAQSLASSESQPAPRASTQTF